MFFRFLSMECKQIRFNCNWHLYDNFGLKQVTMEGECFHKTCFKCAHGGCPLTHSSYASLDGVLYCKHHFAQLFMEKGNYSHVLKSASHRRTTSSSSTPPPEQVETKPDDHEPGA